MVFKKETYHRRTHEEAKKLEEFDEHSLAHISKEIVIRRTVLIGHFLFDIFIGVLLFVINYFTSPSIFEYPWVLWAISGMIFLLCVHCIAYYIFRRGYIYVATESIVAHLGAYLIGNAYVFFINWFANFKVPERGFPTWAWWVLGAWSALLILHVIIYFMIVPLNHEPKDARWLERKVYSELLKLQKKRGIAKEEKSKKQEENT
jgi:hypothetical protein